jgi:MscS family membrane protein
MNFDFMYQSLFLIANWKWLGLICAVIFGLLLKSISRGLLFSLKKSSRIRQKSHPFVVYFLDLKVENPGSWLVTALFWQAALEQLELPQGLTKYLNLAIHLILAFNLIRIAYLAIDAVALMLTDLVQKTKTSLGEQLVPFASKFSKVMVIILGVLIFLQSFGINVMSLLAGLGLGGLALALAAQDTAANLFGSITILLDRPFKVGDWIKVSDTEGIVEEVGFRSTRIRTFYNSLVTVPNSTMAKEKIDNLGLRPSRRARHILGFEYSTTEKQINLFIERITSTIKQIKDIEHDKVDAFLKELGESSLNVQLTYHIKTEDALCEQRLQQEILLECLRLAAELKINYAYPTRTIYYHNT